MTTWKHGHDRRALSEESSRERRKRRADSSDFPRPSCDEIIRAVAI